MSFVEFNQPYFIFGMHALLALIMGSFLSMLSHRLIEHLDSDTATLCKALIFDRSRCHHCQQSLTSKQLVPLLSWLYYRQKTACCQQSISMRYPLIEIATLLISLLTLQTFMQADGWLGLDLQGWAILIFTWALITITVTDLEHQLIPDRLSLPLLWLGLLVNLSDLQLVSLESAVLGAAVGYSSLWLLFQVHRAITGKEGMGYGDFKLSAALGAWLGLEALIPIFILAGVLATLIMGSILLWKKQSQVAFAFGPWLAIAGWLVLMGWSPI